MHCLTHLKVILTHLEMCVALGFVELRLAMPDIPVVTLTHLEMGGVSLLVAVETPVLQ